MSVTDPESFTGQVLGAQQVLPPLGRAASVLAHTE